MTIRSTLTNTTRMARTAGGSRGTVREFDDAHLVQELKEVDVFHSETHSGVERFQTVGMTAVPLKQQQDQNKKTPAKTDPQQGDWNHSQPTGPAAEAAIMYLNGQRSHPIAFVDDRRVRPYNMKEGEGAHYAPDGSEQMVFFNENGAYVVSLDGKSVKDPNGNKTRMASLRHVSKPMQSHKIEQGQKQQPYKHEGESVNTEVRATKNRIEFYNGDKLIGFYDKGANKWELFEVGGNFKLIIDGSSITAQNGGVDKSFRVDNNHAHISFGGNSIFVDAGGCWSTQPILTKGDPG